MALPRTLKLSVHGLARMLRKHGIGEPHRVLLPEAVWLDHDEEDEAARAAEAEFAEAGLLGRRGLDVDVEDTLHALVRARNECYGWFHHNGATYSVLAAALGSEAVLATCHNEAVTLRQIKQNELATALVGELPDTPALRFQSISLPLAEVQQTLARVADAERGTAPTARMPALRPEIRQLQQLMALPSSGSGQLFVAVRDELGRRTRVEHPVRVVDTQSGRLQNVTTQGSTGERWMVVAPASPSALAERLGLMRRELVH